MSVPAPDAPRRVAMEEPRPRRGRRLLGAFFAVVGVAVALALVVGGFYTWRVWTTLSDVQRESLLPEAAASDRPPVSATAEGSFNYILMGSDSRGEGDQGRSDVLMLAHVPPTRDKVFLISFPRDMWVSIPSRGMAKINAAYAYGGPQLTTRTMESLVGVRMDHAVRIDFEGFMGLTTELGGVTLYNRVPSKMLGVNGSGTTYEWKQGEITIQGEEALTYVRQRYELPNGDLDRAERQRAVSKAILQKLMSRAVLTDPAKFNAVATQVGKYFVVDQGLSNQTIFTTATSMRMAGAADIVMLQAPISGFGRSPDGQSIDIVNEAQLKEMSDAIRTGQMAAYAAKYKDQPFVPKR